MKNKELPLGFGFALAQRTGAMRRFADLSEEQQAEVLRKARAASSKEEMRSLVNELDTQGAE